MLTEQMTSLLTCLFTS